MATSEYRPFVNYVRRALGAEGRDPHFITAAAAYAAAVYYDDTGLGTPEFNNRLAEQKIKGLPLGVDEKMRAKAEVATLYAQYKAFGNTPFTHYMNNLQKPAAPIEDNGTVSLPSAYLPIAASRDSVVRYAMDILSREPQNARGPNWDCFTGYVCDLLRGTPLSRAEIALKLINPDNVRKKAETVVRHWKVRAISTLTMGGKGLSAGANARTKMALEEGWEPGR